MAFQFPRFAVALAAVSLSSTSAFALTAADVWKSWQETSADMGQTLSVGSEESSGGALTLRDVTITLDTPESSVNGTISEVVMTERADGSVSITMSDEFPIDMTVSPEEGESGSFSMLVNQTDLDLVATGEPDAISYSYTVPAVTVTMSDFTMEDESTDLDMVMALASVTGSYMVEGRDPRSIDSNLSAASLTMTLSGADPESPDNVFDMNLTVADVASRSTGTITPFAGMTDVTQMIEAGLETSGTTTHGPMTYTINATDDGETVVIAGKADRGSYDVSLGSDGMSYGGGSQGVSLTISGSEIPFPELALDIAETGGLIRMPMTVSDEPQDIALSMRLVGLTVSEALWSMFDPAGALPRDPANLIVDLSGKANWLIDIFDPAIAEEGIEEAPGQVEQVTVNQLLLSLAGAELTGDGAFEFDNAGPVPQPSGTLNLQLVGANALLDTLVQMGLVPEDQAMGARMMLGLFARPGNGEDTLVSEITVQPDGAILANGQRIR